MRVQQIQFDTASRSSQGLVTKEGSGKEQMLSIESAVGAGNAHLKSATGESPIMVERALTGDEGKREKSTFESLKLPEKWDRGSS